MLIFVGIVGIDSCIFILFLFTVQVNVCLYVLQPLKKGEKPESWNLSSYIRILRTLTPTYSSDGWHFPDSRRHSSNGWIRVTSTRLGPEVLDQAYLVTSHPLDEMLNFVNSSFFWQMDFRISYLLVPGWNFLTILQL